MVRHLAKWALQGVLSINNKSNSHIHVDEACVTTNQQPMCCEVQLAKIQNSTGICRQGIVGRGNECLGNLNV